MSFGPAEKKQYRPIPEEPRYHKKPRKHKRFLLERRLKPGIRDPLFRFRDQTVWHNHGHYEKYADAEKAKASVSRRFYYDRFDYRIVDTHEPVLDHVG